MKKFYQNAKIGPVYDINFKSVETWVVPAIKVQRTDGVEVVSNSQVYLIDLNVHSLKFL